MPQARPKECQNEPQSSVFEGGEGVDSLIKVGTRDVRARALSISGVNFCPGIRFWEVKFARPLGFWQFLTKKNV